jgi:DtxR family transcriptional regulator, Mn-dependent transcriptional regulator
MPKFDINHTVEDYLRSIYRVQERDGRASTTALARELAISAAAVTEMVRRLADLGLLEYQRYQGSVLTTLGMEHAVMVTRRHRLWEVFLINRLGFGWDEVHEIADALEHVASDELVDRLDSYLGHPTHDPHGDPIPTREGVVPRRTLVALAELEVGEWGTVERVSDEFPELLRYASSLGLSIKSSVRVLERIAFDGSIRVATNDVPSVISQKLASSVFVQRHEQAPAPARGRKKREGK